MEKSGFTSQRINKDEKLPEITGVTSLTISNYGDTDLTVIVNDVPRPVPAFNQDIKVPFGSFNLPGDGTACDVRIELKFQGGRGQAILDYRKLIKQADQC